MSDAGRTVAPRSRSGATHDQLARMRAVGHRVGRARRCGNAEVDYLGPARREDGVAWLDIPVHDAVRARRGEALTQPLLRP